MIEKLVERIETATKSVTDQFGDALPSTALILGSGLGSVVDGWDIEKSVKYSELDGFPVSSIAGHKGELAVCRIKGEGDQSKSIFVMRGRFHFYESYSLQEVTLPIRVLYQLGVKNLLVTCAAGGVADQLQSGDLMMINDHLNMMGSSPLFGANIDAFGERFPDMSEPYERNWIERCLSIARQSDIGLKRGVYAAFTGPQYETPAEVQMVKRLGGDAVGMSTVPEVIVAKHQKMKVLGLAMIANPAAGLSNTPLRHEDVVAATGRAAGDVGKLLSQFILTEEDI
jgi:purine-nucleoside phosphorylase